MNHPSEMLNQADAFITGIKHGEIKPTPQSVPAMMKLHRNLDRYQDLLLEMVLTIQEMKRVLRKEIHQNGGTL